MKRLSSKNWVVCGFEGDLTFFKTEKEANEYAEEVLDHYRDEAVEGWDDDVENIFVATITRNIKKKNEHAPSEDEFGHGVFDYICDYAFEPVESNEYDSACTLCKGTGERVVFDYDCGPTHKIVFCKCGVGFLKAKEQTESITEVTG